MENIIFFDTEKNAARMRSVLTLLLFSCLLLLINGANANSIDLLDVTNSSQREYSVNAGFDGALSAEVAFPLKNTARKLWYGQELPLPKFRLHYHSHRGNGLLGRNWHLEFHSSIGVCSHSEFGLETQADSATLENYCLDGKPLIAVTNAWLPNYQGVDAMGHRVGVQPVGDCNGQACHFIVTNQFGETRFYGGQDLNVLNGDASWRNDEGKTLVWSLNKIVRKNVVFEFDVHHDPISGNPLLSYGVSHSPQNPSLAYFFEYQDRLIPYLAEIDQASLNLDRVLTAINIVDLQAYHSGDYRRLALLLLDYHRGIEDMALRTVKSCQWVKGIRHCGTLSMTYRYPGKSEYIEKSYSAEEFTADYESLVQSQECEQRWHLPYGHFFHCGDVLLNPVLVSEFVLGDDVINVEYKRNLEPGFYRPWQIVDRFKKLIATNAMFEKEQVEYRFSWKQVEQDAWGHWKGFKRRLTYLDSTAEDLTIDTRWVDYEGLKVVSSSRVREGIYTVPDIIIYPGTRGNAGARIARPLMTLSSSRIDDIVWGDRKDWKDSVLLNCRYQSNYLGLVNTTLRNRSYQRDNVAYCDQTDQYAHHYAFTGKNKIIGVSKNPKNCSLPSRLLSLGKVDFIDFIDRNSDSAELGSYNESCDVLSSYIFHVGKLPPSATTLPPFRPPGIPAPELPEDTDSIGKDGE